MADFKPTWVDDGKGLSRWHPGYGSVKADTKVYFVGESLIGIVHNCPNRKNRQIRVDLYQPTHDSTPAAFCEKCNCLWLGKDPPDASSV